MLAWTGQDWGLESSRRSKAGNRDSLVVDRPPYLMTGAAMDDEAAADEGDADDEEAADGPAAVGAPHA